MIFRDPLALTLLLPLLFHFSRRQRKGSALAWPGAAGWTGLPVTFRQRCFNLLPLARGLAVALAVIALARPQFDVRETTTITRGVDLAIAIDLSSSMLAVDRDEVMGRSRLKLAKEAAREFIAGRSGDRICLVAFAARPYSVAPLTLDHDWLVTALDRLEVGNMEDGSSLGDGLLAAINRLRSSPAESRAAIVITDGRANAGTASPSMAAEVARRLGVRVYTVGAGSRGPASFPVDDPLNGVVWREIRAELDEATLTEIARTTGGKFFRMEGNRGLREVFREIDRLEKRTIEEKVSVRKADFHSPLILVALVLLAGETYLRRTWLRGLP